MADKLKRKNIEKNYHFIYFIESHIITNNINLYLSENNSESNSLENIEQNKLNNSKNNFSINIYRFKIYPEKILEKYKNIDEFKIEIIVEDKKNNKNTIKINNLDLYHDNYLYDFKITYYNNLVILIEKEQLRLGYPEKFQIFLNYLRNNKITRESEENEDFIYSTLKIFNKENKMKFGFSFFISIFLETFKSKYLDELLEIFIPQNIYGFEYIPEEKLTEFINALNIIDNKILEKYVKKDNKENLIFNFYNILLYISFKYNKEKLDEIFKNEKIKKYLYKSLIMNQDFFSGFKMSKKQIMDLINFDANLNNLNHLINILKYNDDFIILLQVINEKKDLFLKENINICIDMELVAIPKKEDNLKEIYNQIKDLISFEKNSSKKFFEFGSNLFEKYIYLIDNSKLEKYIYIKKIINLLKEEKQIIFKINIDEIIHNNGISLSIQGKLTNIEILNFIDNDIYYKEKKYANSNHRSIDILSGIDITKINQDFWQKWKKIKIFQIFENQKESLIIKICNLIQDLSHFNILFDLLNQSQDNGANLTVDNFFIIFYSPFRKRMKCYY